MARHRQLLTRRAALIRGLVFAACSVTPVAAETFRRVAEIERRLNGRLGVGALNTATDDWLTYRGRESFAMCSTFKWILVALVQKRIEQGRLTYGRRITYSKADLLDYAPATRASAARGWMTVEDLCAAAVEVSDNTAANLLLAQVGGPQAVTGFVRAHGDGVTRLDRIEPMLNQNGDHDLRDTTSPIAMTQTMQRILLGNVLHADSRERLIGWMINSTRGLDRLRAGFPATWRTGDKAGTGQNGAFNDVAVSWPPRRPPILVACYISGGDTDAAVLGAVQAEVARTIVEHWS